MSCGTDSGFTASDPNTIRVGCRRTSARNASVISVVSWRWVATSFQEMSNDTCA